MRLPHKTSAWLILLALPALLSGCKSAYIQATITNAGNAPLSQVEVDYPSAGFGTNTLAVHADYRYHFKVQGSGPISIQFTDAQGKLHQSAGPNLSEGEQGTLKIEIDPADKVTWTVNLSHEK